MRHSTLTVRLLCASQRTRYVIQLKRSFLRSWAELPSCFQAPQSHTSRGGAGLERANIRLTLRRRCTCPRNARPERATVVA